eukprot:1136414-Pelagomonas_calceolata.AAC.2
MELWKEACLCPEQLCMECRTPSSKKGTVLHSCMGTCLLKMCLQSISALWRSTACICLLRNTSYTRSGALANSVHRAHAAAYSLRDNTIGLSWIGHPGTAADKRPKRLKKNSNEYCGRDYQSAI